MAPVRAIWHRDRRPLSMDGNARVSEAERAAWVAFNRTPGIGARRVALLLRRYGSLVAAWQVPARELRLAGLDQRAVASIEHARATLDPARELDRVHRAGATVLTWQDPEYPARLAAIPNPPPVLYVRGALTGADEWALAVVGTRRPTVYGRDVAERFCAEIAAAGITIVSGLAKGIDTHAHRGALAGGGRTLAVLGHGIDTCYPPENRRLAAQIAERGAVLTEYPLGTEPLAENFPPRNRIISGLAAGVLVVEAGEGSGALITCTFAAEQGRDVFAVPGPITSPASRGCHKLIQDGAKLVGHVDDILWELNPRIGSAPPRQLALAIDGPDGDPVGSLVADVPATGDDLEAQVLRHLVDAGVALHVDALARAIGCPIHELTGALTVLEVQGRVRHVGGMRYERAR